MTKHVEIIPDPTALCLVSKFSVPIILFRSISKENYSKRPKLERSDFGIFGKGLVVKLFRFQTFGLVRLVLFSAKLDRYIYIYKLFYI